MPPIKTDTTQLSQEPTKGKKGKKFTTKDSMMSILDQVNQAEESRVNKKIERQHAIKKLVDDKQTRSTEKKKKKTSRLEEIKNQLRKGYSLSPQNTPVKKPKKKKDPKHKVARTLSSVNREWSSAFEDENSSSPAKSSAQDTADAKPRKSVTFDL
ncbi:hypothetical protein IWW56_003819 [Coemansia sp. RSA 2131]|nr:hypothetical protein IWW56_003819 [Coemansia sp. RSA 2131]